MLLVIALVLVFFTFAFWIGIPIFLVGDILVELHIPYFIMIMCIFLSSGLLFSLLFIPLNLKVASMIGKLKQQSTLQAFTRLQLGFVLLCAVSICSIFFLVVWVAEAFQTFSKDFSSSKGRLFFIWKYFVVGDDLVHTKVCGSLLEKGNQNMFHTYITINGKFDVSNHSI